MTTRPLVIINPASAGGKTGQQWPKYASAVRAILPDCDFCPTQQSGDATEITRAYVLNGGRRIVSVGGDGTLHEVINGLISKEGIAHAPDVHLSTRPMGTGSDFCRSLGMPRDIHSAIQTLNSPTKSVDIGWVETIDHDPPKSSAFINIGSFGLSGAVAKQQKEEGKSGALSYVTGILKAIRSYKNQKIQIKLTDQRQKVQTLRQSIFTFAIGNGQYFGNGMRITPKASITNGTFVCVLCGDLNGFEVLQRLPALFKGSHVDKPKFYVFNQVLEVEAYPDESRESPVWIELDGELFDTLPARFRIIPSAVMMSCAHKPF